jgi:hypothetical protein
MTGAPGFPTLDGTTARLADSQAAVGFQSIPG